MNFVDSVSIYNFDSLANQILRCACIYKETNSIFDRGRLKKIKLARRALTILDGKVN